MLRHLLLLALALPLFAEEPISPEARKTLLATHEAQKKSLDAKLEKSPEDLSALTQRGDARLFLGDPKGAVADFEKEIALDPTHDAPHWRLGIAYYFAGAMEKSAKQFSKYHAYDDRDRENGVWQFLANARVKGIEKARGEMLPYTRFDREPFPAVYEMLAGKKTGAEVLAEMERKELKDNGLVMFFAHYYIGLNEQLLGRAEPAREHLAKAVKLAMAVGAKGGPGYMGEVARLHYDAAKK